MATNTLEILIKANAGQAQATLKSLDKTIGKFGASSGKGFDTLKAKWAALDAKMSSPAGMKAIIGTSGAVVGALAGVGIAVKKLADDYMDYAFQVKDFGRIIGATPEEASKLIQVADDVRLSVESMTTAMRSAITKGYAPTIAELGRMSDQYLAIQDPIERSRFLVETFGRSGLEMAKLLELGSAKITEMGDSIEGTSRLMTSEGIKAAEAYYIAMDKLGEAGENVTLTLGGKFMPVVAGMATELANLAESALEPIAAFGLMQRAMEAGEITLLDTIHMTSEYMTNEKSWADIIVELNGKLAAQERGLESVRIGTTDLIQPTKEVADETEEFAGTVDKAAASTDKFAGAIRRVPKSINIGFDFKMPDITSELETLVKGDKWRSAGGAAIEEFWSGVRGNVEGLSGDALQAAASKIGALELAAKVEIGEISKQEAISQLQAAFGGTGGEAAATINAALAIDPNSVEEIKSYLKTVLTEPTTFTVTPTADPVSLEELKTAMAGPFDASVNVIASDTSKPELINKIKGFVKGEEIPVTIVAHLKEMSVAELAALAAQLAPKPVDITVNPTVDQAALDFLYETQLGAEAYPVMTPKVNMSALEAARAIMSTGIMVPLIPVGGSVTQAQIGKTDIGRKELLAGRDINMNGIIGAKYGLDMTIPPGFPNDSFRVAVTSGERVQVTRPGEKSGNTVNNFYITGGSNWNVRELARQVTREQQRAGVK